MTTAEDVIRPQTEVGFAAFVFDGEAFDRDAIDRVSPRTEVVAPRQVIARARRENAHVRVPRQVFGDVPCVQLGAAVDIGPVSLHDDRQVHPSTWFGMTLRFMTGSFLGRVRGIFSWSWLRRRDFLV